MVWRDVGNPAYPPPPPLSEVPAGRGKGGEKGVWGVREKEKLLWVGGIWVCRGKREKFGEFLRKWEGRMGEI